jgi:hypothetical protein
MALAVPTHLQSDEVPESFSAMERTHKPTNGIGHANPFES